MSLNQVKRLNTQIKQSYQNWISDAPEEYLSDMWFRSRIPVAVTSRYGQNQPIGLETMNDDEESYTWDTLRDWSRLKYVTVAVATHLRSRLISHSKLTYHTNQLHI